MLIVKLAYFGANTQILIKSNLILLIILILGTMNNILHTE